ncbi:MAG: response regulator [Bacteroidota bacterium]
MTTILIIEDEKELRENLKVFFDIRKYNTLVAANGLEALGMLDVHTPDIIICDVKMPEMDGYALLQRIRKKEAFAAIPFLFLTAKTSYEDARTGMNLGADDYLYKPFSYKQLEAAVNARLRRLKQYVKLTPAIEHMGETLTKIGNAPEELKEEILLLQERLRRKSNQIEAYHHIASHEIRGPVANIMGLVEMLDVEGDGMGVISKLKSAADQLDKTIFDLHNHIDPYLDQYVFSSQWGGKDKVSNIYLLDDSPVLQLIFRQLIKKYYPDITPYIFSSIEEVLLAVEDDKIPEPDIFFLDINLKGENGWEMLEALNERSLTWDVLILTSAIEKEERQKAFTFDQVKGFLIKPLTLSQLNYVFRVPVNIGSNNLS